MRPNSRALVTAVCAVFLTAACTTTESAPPPVPAAGSDEPLTAQSALGEFSSLDYCSLVELRNIIGDGNAIKAPLSSFEHCRLEFIEGANRYTITTGPIASGQDPNIQPYDYAGNLPLGLSVQQSTFNAGKACTRLITFADGIRLSVVVTSDNKDLSDQLSRCRKADATVGTALAAVKERRVGRLTLDDRSWGRVAPCVLLDRRELDAAAGPETEPAPALTEHSCIRGKVSVALSVGADTTPDATEALGGRQVQVTSSGAFCQVTTHRPIPRIPDRVEQAMVAVVNVAGNADDATCASARQAAAAVFPKLP